MTPETTATTSQPKPLTPEEIERHWYENTYAGDRMPQLTLRAAIMGMLLGGILCLSNIYVGLKAGWGLGVAITACILAYAIFESLSRVFPKWFGGYSILENNAMQSAASAAGYMSGSGLVNAIPALMMLNPGAVPTNHWWLVAWVVVISCLGVFLAVPAKRQLINVEQLPYPSGIAAATTLKTLHTKGKEAALQARALGLGGLAGLVIKWCAEANASWLKIAPISWMPKWAPFTELTSPTWAPWLKYPKFHSTWGTNWLRVGTYDGQPLMLNQLTLAFEGSLLFVAAGAIISFRQAWSLMLGAALNYGVLAPIMLAAGDIEAPSFRRISSWSLWIGVPMMVTSGLLLFFMQWKTIVRAFGTLTAFFSRGQGAAEDPLARIEVPGSWFLAGVVALGTAAVFLGHHIFGISWWMGVIAVLATFFLVMVAARAVGETDITPTGPLSKITQLSFGAIAPGNVTANLMTANITAGSCSHAGDLLTDLKSGYLLGANPRQQFLAQFLGVLAGGLVAVPAFFSLIPDPSLLGTEQWPAPAALVWRGVAELLSKGVAALPYSARVGLVIGSVVGILIPLLEMRFPKGKKYIPSATGLGLAFTINGFNSVSFFIGSCLALAFAKWKPEAAKKYTVPVSSGVIAGESLMGVLISFLMRWRILGP